MVTRRIAQIRSEQKSRWQKILDLVRTSLKKSCHLQEIFR